MCARGLHMCGFSSHIFCWEDRAALTGIIFLEGLLGFAPHCLAVFLEPEVTSLLPAWGEDLQEVSPLQEKLEVGITLQTWGSREQKTTLEKLQEKCKRSEITSRPSLESHKSSWLCKHTRTQKVLRCDNNVAAVWPWITVWFRPLGSAAYLGALRSFVSPSGPWHTGVTPQTCFSRVLFVCTTWCHPELPTLSVFTRHCVEEKGVYHSHSKFTQLRHVPLSLQSADSLLVQEHYRGKGSDSILVCLNIAPVFIFQDLISIPILTVNFRRFN